MERFTSSSSSTSRKRARLSNTDYTVACLVPLGIELAPLRAILDSVHEDLPTNRAQNAYILGALGQHNIVIAVLPSTGNNESGVTANQLLNDFPCVQFGILVGIAGGVPDLSGKQDIRLGDVVVSEATGTAGGVIQFDRGKSLGHDKFQLTGHLNKPFSVLNATIKKLKAQHMQEGSQVQVYLQDMLRRNPRMGGLFARPSSQLDRLFESDYGHVDGDGCQNCDMSRIVQRPMRPEHQSVIHYGTIGSSNKVIRSASERDELCRKYAILAVETEAAGLMDTFPCLVVRGICDYADSHKNDIWQPYAAAVAAAYTREVLQAITPISVSPSTAGRKPGVTTNPRFEKLFKSLTFDRMDARQRNIENALVGTCRWIFHDPIFQRWTQRENLAGNNGFLWIKGKPGCGKSTIMKTVLNWANDTWSEELNVSFFFNARASGELEKSSLGFYRSILAQLLQNWPSLHESFLDTFKLKLKDDDFEDWTLSELRAYLMQSISTLADRSLNLFVDALDEGNEDDIRQMVIFLEDMTLQACQNKSKLRICLSSRHFPHISIRKGLFVVVENQSGHETDIRRYITSRMPASESAELVELRNNIQIKSAGIFLWVVLVVAMLRKVYDRYRSISAMSQRLLEMPSELDELFTKILDQSDDDMQECLNLLQWVLFAKDTLNPRELYHAIKISTKSMAEFEDTLKVTDVRFYLLHASRGLVELTRSSPPTVQFIHETVRDFLTHKGLAHIDHALATNVRGTCHEKLKQACVHLLHSCTESSVQRNQIWAAYLFETGLGRKVQFIRYAALNLFWHAENAAKHGVSQRHFLSDLRGENNMFFRDWILYHDGVRHHTKSAGYEVGDDLLYVVVRERYENLVQCLVDCAVDPNMRVREYDNILQFACLRSTLPVVACLIKAGASINVQGGIHGNALQAACYVHNEEIVRILLEHGAEVNAIGGMNGSAIEAACMPTGIYKPIVRLLLDHGINIDIEGRKGSALQFAIRCDTRDLVEYLLENGANVNAQIGKHGNALHTACSTGSTILVRLLLSRGANVNAQGGEYGTALAAAIVNDQRAVMKLLLKHNVDVKAACEHEYGILLFACFKGIEETVRLLLEHGADPNFRGQFPYSPLAAACYKGAKGPIKALLEHGASIDDQSAVNIARSRKHRGLLKLLRQYGMDVDRRSGQQD